MSATIRVTVGNVRHEKAKNRYRLDWTIYVPEDERPKRNKLATHPDKDELQAFRTDLLRAIERNRPVDLGTGLPEGVERPHQQPTILSAASRPLWLDIRDRLHEKWDGEGHNGERKGHTVKGWANEWIAFIMAFLRADAPALTRRQREGARDYLRRQLVPAEVWQRLDALDEHKRQVRCAGGPKDKQQRYRWARSDRERARKQEERLARDAQWKEFFDRYGMRWYEVNRPTVLAAIAALKLRVDGAEAQGQTVTKHTVALNEMLKWAVRTGRLSTNPFTMLEKHERPSTTTKIKKVNQRRVPPMSRVVALINYCRELALAGNAKAFRVLPYLALIALAGFRPSEARGIRADELRLPERGWGLATLGRRITSPGRAFTSDGSPHEVGAMKWCQPGDSRDVPLPPMLVRLLRSHVERFALGGDDLVVCDEDGKELDTTTIDEIWQEVRAGVFTDPDEADRFLSLDIGELRHTRATLLLAAGMPQLIVATWLGHSILVLNSMYAGIIATRSAGFGEEIARYREDLIPPDYETGPAGQVSVPKEELAMALKEALAALGADGLAQAGGMQGFLGQAGFPPPASGA
jgi:hypothetical protein